MLVELRRAQPDDGEYAEQRQSQPEPRADVAGAQRARHRQHTDVDAEVGDDEIAAAVSREVEPEDEQYHRADVDPEQDELGHRASSS